MPRLGNGDYVLPAGNPVVSGTIISSAWANTTFDDVALALTNSLSRDGDGGMRVPLLFDDGDATAPGISWVNEPSSGIYRSATAEFIMDVGVNNIQRWTTNWSQLTRDNGITWEEILTDGGAANQVPVNIGTVQGQTLRWDEDITKEWQATSALIVSDVGVEVLAGTAALPSYTFTGDPDTGMWWPAADTIAWSTFGVEAMRISPAGNVGVGGIPTDTAGQRRLKIAGENYCQISVEADGGEIVRFVATTGEGQIAYGTHDFIFFEGVLERMRIATGTGIITGLWNDFAVGNASAQFQKLTQAQYDGITPDANTIYFIVG